MNISIPTVLSEYRQIPISTTVLDNDFIFYRLLAGNPNRNKCEGFYTRMIYSPLADEFCLQVVLYYRIQKFPYHVNDYHPFYLYYDKGYKPLRMLYDSGHHQSRESDSLGRYIMTIRFPWHGYNLGRSLFSIPFRAMVFDLDDEVLRSWWLQPGKPQFKLRTKLVDPWHVGLFSTSTGQGNFRDEAVCPICHDTTLLDTMNLAGDIFQLPITCRNNHQFLATYEAQHMRFLCQPL